MYKPLSWLAAVTAASLALSACGGTSTSGTTEDGIKTGAGFDGTTITVGILNPTSGPIGAGAGLPILEGLQFRLDRVNAEGGIAGKYKVKLKVTDTKYDPETALKAYNGMADNVTMIGSVLGTGVVQALIPKFTADKVLAIATTDDAAFVKEPNLLPTRPTYQVSFINGLAHLTEQEGGKDLTYCTLRQDDASGEAYKSGIDFGAKELGIKIAEDVAFPNDTTDFTAQIQRLKRANCDVVSWAAAASFAQGVISSSVQLDFTPKWLSLASGVPLFLMGSPASDYIAKNFLVSTPGAQWGDTSVEGMKQLVADFEAYGKKGDKPNAALWPVGYDYGIAITTLLEKAVERGEVSPAKILEISHSSDFTIDFLGLTPTFNYGPPEDRTAPTAVSIFSVDPETTGFLKTVASNVDSDAAKKFQDQ